MSITAVDTNVLSELFLGGPRAGACAASLQAAAEEGELRISAIVVAELFAATAAPDVLKQHLVAYGFRVDAELSPDILTRAATAWNGYLSARRRRGGSLYHCPDCGHPNSVFSCRQCGRPLRGGPRHILADFLVGAHAESVGARLLTLEQAGGLYRTYFPGLEILVPADASEK